jgi:hypothetical protein
MSLVYKIRNKMATKTMKFTIGICVMSLVFLTISCQDSLEEEVYSSYTSDDFFVDAASSELGLIGIYDHLSSKDLFSRDYMLEFDGSNDEERYWRQNRGLMDDLLANYQVEETNAQLGLTWAAFYKTIYRANLVIDKVTILVKNLENSSSLSDKQISELKRLKVTLAEAHFLRGFLYFEVVKVWGDVPLRLKSQLTFNDLKMERTPQLQVYQQIEKDMLAGIPQLPQASMVSAPYRMNQGAARGVLARFYLKWAGYPLKDVSKFQKAAEQTYAVITSGQHALNPVVKPVEIGAPFNHPFPQVFRNYSENVYDLKESMFEIHFSYPGESENDGSYVGAWHGVQSHDLSIYGRGASRRYALPTFYDSFEADDTARRDWSISQFEIKSDNSFVALPRSGLKWGVGKFRRYLMPKLSPNLNVDAMNWPVLRYADVLLMFAESVNETIISGGVLPAGASVDMAYEAVNEVRRRARMLDPKAPNVSIDLKGGAGEAFRKQLYKERSWELCFENHRRQDLIRWGILVETVRQTGVKLAAVGVNVTRDYLPAATIQNKHVLMPIPFNAEISQNPLILITDPTNNGYR